MYLWCIFIFTVIGCTSGACPWDEANLQRWSDSNTWGGTVPGENGEVVISGKRVLLDVTPPNLATIEISSDAALIWDNIDGTKLTVSYILVNGEFHIGSEDCPLTKKADIFLTGKSNSPYTASGFGRKFIGVAAGGTLEVHGAPKKAWTKLIQTMPAAHRTCGVIYRDEPQKYATTDAFGLHVAVWNPDGSLNDYTVFPLADASKTDAEQNFQNFVDSVADGLIVGAAVYGNLGVTSVPGRNWETVYAGIEKLGGLTSGSSEIRTVSDNEAYAFITYTGDASSTSEHRTSVLSASRYAETPVQTYTHQATDLVFRSGSIVTGSSNNVVENGVVLEVLTTQVGQPILSLRDDVSSWVTGDEIIVTSTDYDWKQVEEFKLLDCPSCSNNQIKLDGPFKYSHFGEITHGVDERAEVALLTRNIKIEAELQPECYDNGDPLQTALCDKFGRDTFGGHIKFLRDASAVHVEGVENVGLGQQLNLGTYPFHFHMADDVDGNWLRNNSIHHTNNRCVTIHGTDGAEVSDIVCYDHLGHGFFLEDSAEQRNILKGNLGVGTRHGTQLLTDMHPDWCPSGQEFSCNNPSTFWITHPNNFVDNNVAAGSEKMGFFIVYAREPLTISKGRQDVRGLVTKDHARYSKLASFEGNVAHSNKDRGLMFDRLLANIGDSVPENGLILNSLYDPREEPNENSPRATSYVKRMSSYKNKVQNIWSRGGNIVYDHVSLADSIASIEFVKSSGTTDTAQEITNSVIIGETDNLGEPYFYTSMDHADKPTHQFSRSLPHSKPNTPIRGIQGIFGIILANNNFFDKFNHWTWNKNWETTYGIDTTRYASAIGFRGNFPYPTFPHNGILDSAFGFCNNVDGIKFFAGNSSLPFFDEPRDGDRQATFRDYNGELTGIPNVQLVQPTPFFLDNDCYFDTDSQMSVCPHMYSRVSFSGNDGIFLNPKRKDYPMYMVRDDISDSPFAIRGDKNLEYLSMQNRTYTAYFNGTNPVKVTVGATNLEQYAFIRVGLCFPKSTTQFKVRGIGSLQGIKAVEVNSIADLDADSTGTAYFWDSATGLFFVKLIGLLPRGDLREDCPGKSCPKIVIERLDGDTAATDCYNDAYGPYKATPISASPVSPPSTANCVRDTIGDRGAVDSAELSITAPVFQEDCKTSDTANDFQACGRDNAGKRIGNDGNCLLVLNPKKNYMKSAYDCFRRFGSIVADSRPLGEIRQHIFRTGKTDRNYWIHGVPSVSSKAIALSLSNFYNPEETSRGKSSGTVCEIATSTACPPGSMWLEYSNTCYGHNEFKSKSYDEATALCDSPNTELLTIKDSAEATAVIDFIGSKLGTVFLALKYSDANSRFEWPDGTVPTYTNWGMGNGPEFVDTLGKCAILLTRNSVWRNFECEGGSKKAGVVCQGPTWSV